MTEQTPHTKILFVSFTNQEETTNGVINNFKELLSGNSVFGRKWGFERKKVEATENSFYIEGGRMGMPKRQITFNNIEPPIDIFDNQENIFTKDIIEYCNSADIFLLCIDFQNLPETSKINRLAYTIKHVDREKTILYATLNTNSHCRLGPQSPIQNNFDNYANFIVAQHIELINCTAKELSEEMKNLLQYDYLFPYTDTQCFSTPQNYHFNLRKNVFCFSELGDESLGYIDSLLYCLNTIYASENLEITMSNNKLYHYLTTNINFNTNNYMAKKNIKLAIVGAADNGKSHFISDVFRGLQLMGINSSTKKYSDYAQVAHYLNQIVGKKEINPTDSMSPLTRNEHHYKGPLGKYDIDIEFMDIPGEAFMDAEKITGAYQQIKDSVRDCYSHSYFQKIFKKKKNIFFIEEYRIQGNSTKITLSLNIRPFGNTEEAERKRIKDSNTEDEDKQIADSERTIIQENKPDKIKYVSGKYVVENFEKYDTENLKSVLKLVVEEQKDNSSYPNLKNLDDDFWRNFYAYVFCDSCDDIILCELLALPKSTAEITKSSEKAEIKESDFTNCLNGIKTFFTDKTPRMYIVFRGLDAMLKHEDEIFKDMFGKKKGESIIKCAPYIYLLIHLAIYKKYMINIENVSEKFDELINSIINNEENSFLRNTNLKHLFDKDSKQLLIRLDNILLDRNNFDIPRDSSNQGIESHLAARISDIKNFGRESRRFMPSEDVNINNFTNFILPHIYFTAYPIDAINLTVHKNSSTNRQTFDGLNVGQRLPLGTLNFIADLLNANGIEEFHENSDLENFLYKK